jgi:hypothetical protein
MDHVNSAIPEIKLGLDNLEPRMVSVLKSTVLSVGLLAGLAATGNAQSVSALPPDGNTPQSYGGTLPVQNPHTGIAGSTQSFYPKPGGGGLWNEGHYQPSAQSATGVYPSTNETGPKPH